MHTPRHYPLHLIIVPIMELALMLAIAAYITTIDMNLLYLLSITLGASIAWFLGQRTIEDYYNHNYTKYKQSIALMVSNLLCLMVVTYYNVSVFVAILVYVGIYTITRKEPTMSTHPYGNNYKITVTKYTDEDLDIVTDQLNLEIKSDKLIHQGDVLNGISSMFHRGIFRFNIETVGGSKWIDD